MRTCWWRPIARCIVRRPPVGIRWQSEGNRDVESFASFRPGTVAPRGGHRGGTPDPWGMKRVENLITTLTGILSARVVTTPLGEVSEVHVLTRRDMQPKQVGRKTASAL